MASICHKNFIHIHTEHSLTHFCSHFRVWKGLQPSLQHMRQGRQAELLERLSCAKAVQDTEDSRVTSSLLRSHLQLSRSSEAAPAGSEAVLDQGLLLHVTREETRAAEPCPARGSSCRLSTSITPGKLGRPQ